MTELWLALGIGTGTRGRAGQWLDVLYPQPRRDIPAKVIGALETCGLDPAKRVLVPTAAELRRLAEALHDAGAADLAAVALALDNAQAEPVVTVLRQDDALQSTAETWLKLHLLSWRLALPNTLNLAGMFASLPNLAWTDRGPLEVDTLPTALLRERLAGRTLGIHAIDKIPRMVDYVVPTGVRIADANRIRLGAYLGEGTTVMHEGFVNFNAAAMGPNMIEGRISQGVVVGAHSDLGGSASTMGTLSGGNDTVISIGEECLIGANAGTGIPLGDRCTIAAGLYITAGTSVDVVDEARQPVATVKARELAGNHDMLFVRNSATGRVECRTNRSAIALNQELHAHN